MVSKAHLRGADAICLDLEDSVPDSEKEKARALAARYARRLASVQPVYVRINAIGTDLALQDIEVAAQQGVAGLVIPKCGETARDVATTAQLLEDLEAKRGMRQGATGIIPLLETAKGVKEAERISVTSPRFHALMFGVVDYASDMGTEPAPANRIQFLYARSRVALIARAIGLLAIDTPYMNFADAAGLRREATMAKKLGYAGKFLIHPNQVEIANETFTPTPAEIRWASQILRDFKQAVAKGKGAISAGGQVLDMVHLRRAQEIARTAKIIEEMKGKRPASTM